MSDENNILELTPELLEFWKNSFADEFVYPEKENKEPKKLKGKLFSRENIGKDKYQIELPDYYYKFVGYYNMKF